jgi:23S rRNA-/tRNA-specific pseudouridylate synthase
MWTFDDGTTLEERTLHREGPLWVVDKPAGLATSGRALDDPDCLQWVLMQHLGRMIWAVHQLDRDTSGVNVFVTRRSVVGRWQEALRPPQARKTYLAWVHGHLDAPVTVEAPLGALDADGRRLGVHPAGRPAWSRFEPLAQGASHSLLQVEIRTGRTHQIRIHLQTLGLALVGEPWYRDPPCSAWPRHALHAWRLTVHRERPWTAPIPPDLHTLSRRLGLVIPPGFA